MPDPEEADDMVIHSPNIPSPLHILRQRVHLFQWLVPTILLLIVIAYEAGPSRWINNDLGGIFHAISEILIYGTIGPVLAFVLLHILNRWLEERETSEVQAQVLAKARERAANHTQLSDDVLQSLFAANTLLNSLESEAEISPEARARLHVAQQALDASIVKLHAQLQDLPKPKGKT